MNEYISGLEVWKWIEIIQQVLANIEKRFGRTAVICGFEIRIHVTE